MKKIVTIKPKWMDTDSITGDNYFYGNSDYDIELDIPDEKLAANKSCLNSNVLKGFGVE